MQSVKEISDALSRHAYSLFESRGHQDGHDLEDWFRAESELLRPVPVEIGESDDEVIARADVPGFRERDIELYVEPRRLIVSGQRAERVRKIRSLYRERRSDEILRIIDLPVEIDCDSVKATLHNGTLEVRLPKATRVRKGLVSNNAA